MIPLYVIKISFLLLILIPVHSQIIQILEDTSFRDLVDNHPEQKWFINFYARWGPASKQFESSWRYLAEHDDSGVLFGEVDVMAERLLVNRFQISHYPTILFITNGTMIDYSGKRSMEEVTRYKSFESQPLPFYPSRMMVIVEEKVVQNMNQWLFEHCMVSVYVPTIDYEKDIEDVDEEGKTEEKQNTSEATQDATVQGETNSSGAQE
ncbi:thioredoxin-like protein [Blastocystis sp. subtype 4]|uniref:thioredoxin-like protein n=1 Tax=Blastocystis sp. subtype 4 TaxID=944170 RepID=UPI000711FE27|nr:thioredoxin-like protein [Blastocystis sp. subtype 4]KNB44146.1 thioredoxin-like protein [Blastocystis sp. subtype 4]|eukprot:XP_014527585.1 thioredoxin-like protein [Blastocystis sp. subtype 4]